MKEDRLLTKDERDEVYDAESFGTVGEERRAYCKAQDANANRMSFTVR